MMKDSEYEDNSALVGTSGISKAQDMSSDEKILPRTTSGTCYSDDGELIGAVLTEEPMEGVAGKGIFLPNIPSKNNEEQALSVEDCVVQPGVAEQLIKNEAHLENINGDISLQNHKMAGGPSDLDNIFKKSETRDSFDNTPLNVQSDLNGKNEKLDRDMDDDHILSGGFENVTSTPEQVIAKPCKESLDEKKLLNQINEIKTEDDPNSNDPFADIEEQTDISANASNEEDFIEPDRATMLGKKPFHQMKTEKDMNFTDPFEGIGMQSNNIAVDLKDNTALASNSITFDELGEDDSKYRHSHTDSEQVEAQQPSNFVTERECHDELKIGREPVAEREEGLCEEVEKALIHTSLQPTPLPNSMDFSNQDQLPGKIPKDQSCSEEDTFSSKNAEADLVSEFESVTPISPTHHTTKQNDQIHSNEEENVCVSQQNTADDHQNSFTEAIPKEVGNNIQNLETQSQIKTDDNADEFRDHELPPPAHESNDENFEGFNATSPPPEIHNDGFGNIKETSHPDSDSHDIELEALKIMPSPKESHAIGGFTTVDPPADDHHDKFGVFEALPSPTDSPDYQNGSLEATPPPANHIDDEFGDFEAMPPPAEGHDDEFGLRATAPSAESHDDEFGDFEATPLPAERHGDAFGDFEAPSLPVDSHDDEFGDFEAMPPPVDSHDDEFGDFEATPVPIENNDDKCGDFEVTPSPVDRRDDEFRDSEAIPTPADTHGNELGDQKASPSAQSNGDEFGEFEVSPGPSDNHASVDAKKKHPEPAQVFSAPSDKSAANIQQGILPPQDNAMDDFGDFSTFDSPKPFPTPLAQDEGGADDDFGAFADFSSFVPSPEENKDEKVLSPEENAKLVRLEEVYKTVFSEKAIPMAEIQQQAEVESGLAFLSSYRAPKSQGKLQGLNDWACQILTAYIPGPELQGPEERGNEALTSNSNFNFGVTVAEPNNTSPSFSTHKILTDNCEQNQSGPDKENKQVAHIAEGPEGSYANSQHLNSEERGHKNDERNSSVPASNFDEVDLQSNSLPTTQNQEGANPLKSERKERSYSRSKESSDVPPSRLSDSLKSFVDRLPDLSFMLSKQKGSQSSNPKS